MFCFKRQKYCKDLRDVTKERDDLKAMYEEGQEKLNKKRETIKESEAAIEKLYGSCQEKAKTIGEQRERIEKMETARKEQNEKEWKLIGTCEKIIEETIKRVSFLF